MDDIKFMLAIYDKNMSTKWHILNRNFVIEPNPLNTIQGVFLRDLWFCHYIMNGNYPNSIYFMLIKSTQNKKKILDDLNRNHSDTDIPIPSINDKPLLTSHDSYYFVIEKDNLNMQAQNILDTNQKTMTLSLLDLQKFGAHLKIKFLNIKKKVYISLPAFYFD